MAYSDNARLLRQCLAVKADGTQCRAFAMWGDPDQLCSAHNGHTRAEDKDPSERCPEPRTSVYCYCAAYPWPHRPGGGLCNWPDGPTRCYPAHLAG